jgi:hypothetical protein
MRLRREAIGLFLYSPLAERPGDAQIETGRIRPLRSLIEIPGSLIMLDGLGLVPGLRHCFEISELVAGEVEMW